MLLGSGTTRPSAAIFWRLVCQRTELTRTNSPQTRIPQAGFQQITRRNNGVHERIGKVNFARPCSQMKA